MRRLRRCAQAEKPAGVARIEPGEREEHEEIGGVELLVPGGLAAHESAEAEVAPDERRRLDGQGARPVARREWPVGEDPPSFGAEVLFAQPAADGRRRRVSVRQAHARAAHDVAAAGGVDPAEQRRPEERDDGPVPEVGMHAGAADLRGDRPEAAEPAQVELPLRVEAARRARPLGGKDAIGPDQRSALTLAHQEWVAEHVELVAIEARCAPPESRTPHAGDPCAHRVRVTVARMQSTAPMIPARVAGLQRTGYVPPYLAELIIDAGRRRGAGACVEVRLGADADRASLDAL